MARDMSALSTRILATILLVAAAFTARAGEVPHTLLPWWDEGSPLSGTPTAPVRLIPGSAADRERPLLSVSLLEPDATTRADRRHAGWSGWLDQRFMLSMDRWESGPSDQAHIRCDGGMLTGRSYRAENCRFVATPAGGNSLDLMRIGGEWLATPEFSLGMGVFRGLNNTLMPAGFEDTESLHWQRPAEGIDVNLSLGLDAGRVGDLLVDLQLARFREDAGEFSPLSETAVVDWQPVVGARQEYGSAAQLSLGWRRGDFSGGIQGQVREMPAWWLNATGQETFRSFDIEFSWRAPWNASFSIGASNFLDNHPGGETTADNAANAADPLEGIYGRIPYVRYKQDL